MSTGGTMRVGYVLKRYPRYSETFVVNEILAHEAAGLDVEIFALRPVIETHFQDVIARVRAPVHHIPARIRQVSEFWALAGEAGGRLPGFWEALASMGAAEGDDVAQAIQLALAVEARGITHLHAHFATVATSVARLASRFARIGYSFTAHAKDIYFDYEEPVGLGPKMADASAAVTVSDYNLAHLRRTFPDAASRLRRLYNGLDLERLHYRAPDPSRRRILAVGRLVEKKGFDVLVDAMGLLRARGCDVDCVIAGEGPERGSLEARIAAAGLSDVVRLAGPLPQQAVFEALREAALMAAPCVVGKDGNRDGLPTVLLEAMALGTPCVSTAVTGIPELVVDGETGLCVAPGDAEALAQAMARLLGDGDLRLALSRKARALIEREFDIHRNAAVLRELFGAAAGGAALDAAGTHREDAA